MSDTSHWYDREGRAVYTVTGSNGKERNTTLRDARKLDLAVGVTSILKVASAPGLVNWQINQAIEACRLNPFCEMGTTKEEWAAKIKELSAQEGKRITGRGSEIHSALERYYTRGTQLQEEDDYIKPVINLMQAHYPGADWVSEETFNYRGLYGGSVDIHCKTGNGVILDFKTKDTADKTKLKGYDTHIMQLAAYAEGLGLPNAQCGNVWISTHVPGMVELEIYTPQQVAKAWSMFYCLMTYWRLERGLDL